MEKKSDPAGIIIFLAILALVMVGFQMFNKSQKNGVANAASKSQEITVGDSTFVPIPVGFSAEPHQKQLAMEAVDKFKKKHPELVILCWNPNYLVGSMNVATDGVFIYHRPK